jgi:hypothetical protein
VVSVAVTAAEALVDPTCCLLLAVVALRASKTLLDKKHLALLLVRIHERTVVKSVQFVS